MFAFHFCSAYVLLLYCNSFVLQWAEVHRCYTATAGACPRFKINASTGNCFGKNQSSVIMFLITSFSYVSCAFYCYCEFDVVCPITSLSLQMSYFGHILFLFADRVARLLRSLHWRGKDIGNKLRIQATTARLPVQRWREDTNSKFW